MLAQDQISGYATVNLISCRNEDFKNHGHPSKSLVGFKDEDSVEN